MASSLNRVVACMIALKHNLAYASLLCCDVRVQRHNSHSRSWRASFSNIACKNDDARMLCAQRSILRRKMELNVSFHASDSRVPLLHCTILALIRRCLPEGATPHQPCLNTQVHGVLAPHFSLQTKAATAMISVAPPAGDSQPRPFPHVVSPARPARMTSRPAHLLAVVIGYRRRRQC